MSIIISIVVNIVAIIFVMALMAMILSLLYSFFVNTVNYGIIRGLKESFNIRAIGQALWDAVSHTVKTLINLIGDMLMIGLLIAVFLFELPLRLLWLLPPLRWIPFPSILKLIS